MCCRLLHNGVVGDACLVTFAGVVGCGIGGGVLGCALLIGLCGILLVCVCGILLVGVCGIGVVDPSGGGRGAGSARR